MLVFSVEVFFIKKIRGYKNMELETIKEKRNNTFQELDFAKTEVENKRIRLKGNLEIINSILYVIKRLKRTGYCFKYLKKNWSNSDYFEKELEKVENSLKNNLHLYEKTVLERKILKAQLKQAQRKFSKKQKSFIKFEKKHYNEV